MTDRDDQQCWEDASPAWIESLGTLDRNELGAAIAENPWIAETLLGALRHDRARIRDLIARRSKPMITLDQIANHIEAWGADYIPLADDIRERWQGVQNVEEMIADWIAKQPFGNGMTKEQKDALLSSISQKQLDVIAQPLTPEQHEALAAAIAMNNGPHGDPK